MTKYNTTTLRNGLRIIHLPQASPVVYCGFQIAAGSRNELPGEEGLAHFCEHMTFKGTQRRSALQVISHLECVGGDLNAFTTKEGTTYYAAVLREDVRRALDLLCDIVFCSSYPEAEIEHEKAVVCDEIESYNDTPSELIYDEFENLIFPGHPLGHNILGTAKNVEGFTADDVRRFARRWYRPDNAIFFASGDLDFNWLVRTLEKVLSALNIANPAEGETAKEQLKPLETFAERKDVVIQMNTHQSHVMIGTQGYSIHHKNRIALFVLNNLLGGPGMSARLNLSLRERNGLVYTVESSMTSYGDAGTFGIYFGCDHHDVKKCLKLVRRELDKLMQSPLSERQLTAVKRQLKGQVGIGVDNREQFSLDFGKSFLHYGWENDLEKLCERIDAVTPEDIHQVACELFTPERLSTLIIR